MPPFGNSQLKLLEKLCNVIAVSGDEGEVRRIVLEEIKPYADEVRVDAIGNVLATRCGQGKNRLRVMLDAHMDEVGFMIVADDGDGIYRFEPVGVIDARHLVGKQVFVGKKRSPGVIGGKAVASTNPMNIGEEVGPRRKERIIKAELGEPVSKEGKVYNVILPVVAGNEHYGYIHLKINAEDFSEILASNAIKRIVATSLVFGLGIILAVFLSMMYTKPIHNVVNAARNVAAGDLTPELHTDRKDEIGELTHTFNYMAKTQGRTRPSRKNFGKLNTSPVSPSWQRVSRMK